MSVTGEPLSLRADANSAAQILSVPWQIFVDERLFLLLDWRSDIPLALFDRTGCLYDPAIGHRTQGVELQAVPHGVLLVGCLQDNVSAAEQIRAAFLHHGVSPPPTLHVATGRDAEAVKTSFLQAVISALCARDATNRPVYARREIEIADLRQRCEWQALSLRLGREMLQAVGFAPRALAYETPVGQRSIGLGGDLATSYICQTLPVNLAAIAAVSVHVASEGSGDGILIATVGSLAGTVLGRVEMPISSLGPGWHELALPSPIGPVHGDALLTLNLITGAGALAPTFSLSDERADRFGLGAPWSDSTLSLKVWKGLSEQAFEDPVIPSVRRSRAPLNPRKLEAVQHVFGHAAEAIQVRRHGGGAIVEPVSDGISIRWLPSEVTGALVAESLPPGTREVSLTIAVDAEAVASAPSQVSLVAAAVSGLTARTTMEAAIRKLLDGSQAEDLVPGVLASEVATIPVGKARKIRLKIPHRAPHIADLVIAVRGANEADTRGRCSVTNIAVETEQQATDILPAFARRIPFAELKRRMEYISGPSEAVRLAAETGLSVFDVSEVEDWMQIHALSDRMSGARGASLLPTGLKRVSAEVMTSHPLGPIVEYGMFVVAREAGREDAWEFQRSLARVLEGSSSPAWLYAHARVLAEPNRTYSLVADLGEHTNQPTDLICTVRNTATSISYGWCRWFSVSILAGLSTATRHELS